MKTDSGTDQSVSALLLMQVFSLTAGCRAGARAVDLGGPSVYQGGPKFEIKRKNRCLQKNKLVNWGGPSMTIGGQAPPGLPLAPAL